MEALIGLVLIVVTIFLVLRVRAACTLPRRFRSRGPACGRCGYAYSGQPRCPECGGLISHVGIITPRLALARGPGPFAAFACLALLAGIIGSVGYIVGLKFEAAMLPSGGRTFFSHSFFLVSEKKHFQFADMRPPRPTELAGVAPPALATSPVSPPPELTILQQFVRNQAGPPPFATTRGQLVVLLHPAKADPGINILGTALASTVAVPFPSIQIDTLTRRTRVLDAQGRQTAEYATIDPRAFDDLIALNQFDSTEEFERLVLQAAASVYASLAARPDNGGWGPDWEFAMQPFFNQSVHIMNTGGMASSQFAPASLLPPRPLIALLWPPVLFAIILLAALIIFRAVLRRRRALMAEPPA